MHVLEKLPLLTLCLKLVDVEKSDVSILGASSSHSAPSSSSSSSSSDAKKRKESDRQRETDEGGGREQRATWLRASTFITVFFSFFLSLDCFSNTIQIC